LDRDFLVARQALSGTDILLTDVAGFDLRAYSPNARAKLVSGIFVEPGDIGYDNTTFVPNLGSFVDLGYNARVPSPPNPNDSTDDSWFAQDASLKSGCVYITTLTDSSNTLINLGKENVYDTWTPFYESDGLNQDGDQITDEGTDGLDNHVGLLGSHVTNIRRPQINGVDDTSERETLPPYPYPIRGLKISIRLVEKDSKQVHQTSIIHSFVPE
jgi:hypothetical protein